MGLWLKLKRGGASIPRPPLVEHGFWSQKTQAQILHFLFTGSVVLSS